MRLAPESFDPSHTAVSPESADLVLAFGSREQIGDPDVFEAVRLRYPDARIVGASTGGEIHGAAVTDGELAVMAVTFERSGVDVVRTPVLPGQRATDAGRRLAAGVAPVDDRGRPLRHVVVLADGIHLNGSELASGVEQALPAGIRVSGALAGDGDRFEETALWADGVLPIPSALAVAFYGETLRVGVGTGGGWDTFGVERRVTRSEGNVLAELDGRPALDLYTEYLGPYAKDLPASGLRFPLAVRVDGEDHSLVRTLLGIDRDAGTMTFAGDVPEGTTARLMRANPDHLVDGAHRAARRAAADLGTAPELALLVSCVGRRWTLGQRSEEEVEQAIDGLGGAPAIGLYAYGELAPAEGGTPCALHNQTMTITAFSEAEPA